MRRISITGERMRSESQPPGAKPGVLLYATVAIDPRSSLPAHKHASLCISNMSSLGGASLAQNIRAGTVPLPQNILACDCTDEYSYSQNV